MNATENAIVDGIAKNIVNGDNAENVTATATSNATTNVSVSVFDLCALHSSSNPFRPSPRYPLHSCLCGSVHSHLSTSQNTPPQTWPLCLSLSLCFFAHGLLANSKIRTLSRDHFAHAIDRAFSTANPNCAAISTTTSKVNANVNDSANATSNAIAIVSVHCAVRSLSRSTSSRPPRQTLSIRTRCSVSRSFPEFAAVLQCH